MSMQKLALLCALLLGLPAWGKPPPKKKKKAFESAPAVEKTEPEAPATVETAPEPAPPPAAEQKPEPPPSTQPVRSAETQEQKPAVADKDLDKLRAEYEQLRDALFRSRARAATVANAMFSTKMTIGVRWKATRHYLVKRAQIRLDEAQVWDSGDRHSGDRPLTDDPVKAAEQAVAPGRHDLTLRLEVRAKDNDKLGYTSEHTFSLDVPENKKTFVDLTADEDGDLPEYKPVVKMELRSEK
jgi:hypothetical protein